MSNRPRSNAFSEFSDPDVIRAVVELELALNPPSSPPQDRITFGYERRRKRARTLNQTCRGKGLRNYSQDDHDPDISPPLKTRAAPANMLNMQPLFI